MRIYIPILLAFSLVASASWFGGDADVQDHQEYSTWSSKDLSEWLSEHSIDAPKTTSVAHLRDLVAANWNAASPWTYDQYTAAQKSFDNIRDTSFDTWDESRLRQFLLEQGIVAPKGAREHLVLLAKSRYIQFTKAASSLASHATAAASSMVYDDTIHQMSSSVSSIASDATQAAVAAKDEILREMDNAKDYIYSSWDNNKLRKYLENKGVIKTKAEKSREEMLSLMRDSYANVANPVWEAWGDSYIHDWLVRHNIIKSDVQKNREALLNHMNKYYYATTDYVWSSWSDSQLKRWLVERSIIKSDAQLERQKMAKLVESHYLSAKDTFWSAWSDSQLHIWLTDHGYLRPDEQVKRDKMITLANEKYTSMHDKTAAYLTWPDARLRAYLRERGVSEDMVPGNRPGLLQETRIRWVQMQTRFQRLVGMIYGFGTNGVFQIQDVLMRVYALLVGNVETAYEKVVHSDKFQDVKKAGEEGYDAATKRTGGRGEKVKVTVTKKVDEEL